MMQTRTMVMDAPVIVPLLKLIMHALEGAQQLLILEFNAQLVMNQTIPQMLIHEFLSVVMG